MSIKKIVTERSKPVDITSLFLSFSDEYRNVFILQLEDNIMIYRSIGRKAYKDILLNKELTDLQKEEVICRECLLYPDPDKFDWGLRRQSFVRPPAGSGIPPSSHDMLWLCTQRRIHSLGLWP